jgi:ABC-type dipeptide/oligopeptide/nickel transport system ATPase subunit
MGACMIELAGVSVEFRRRNRLGRVVETHYALRNISLRIEAGERLGLTGRSGSGKSTLARCLAGWLAPSSGLIDRRGGVQMVMQDAGGSLNPRFTAAGAIEEPLRIKGVAGHPGRDVLEQIGIDGSRSGDLTAAFSGGQRARIAVGRALTALRDAAQGLLILDESLAALDDETRDRILALVGEWNRKRGLAAMIVSHEPELLEMWADRVLTMEAGRIV